MLVVAGCVGFGGGSDDGSQVDVTVQNDRGQVVSFDIVVRADDGTIFLEESDQLESSVAQSFTATGAASGRHEVTVIGTDWRGQLAWNAESCKQFDATIRITDEVVDVVGECLEYR